MLIICYYLDLLTRAQRIVILTKYTIEIQELLKDGIIKAKQEEKLPLNYNITKIPLGMLYFILNI